MKNAFLVERENVKKTVETEVVKRVMRPAITVWTRVAVDRERVRRNGNPE